MGVIGIGIDIVPAERVAKLLERSGERALARLFTAGERERGRSQANPALYFAARIAAKEAAFKALAGDDAARLIGWQELEVARSADGRPTLVLHGRAARRFSELGATRAHLSLTHSGGLAAAVVILE